jgi:hypothetical protein
MLLAAHSVYACLWLVYASVTQTWHDELISAAGVAPAVQHWWAQHHSSVLPQQVRQEAYTMAGIYASIGCRHCIRSECSLTCSMLCYGILLMHAINLYAPLRLLMCIVSDVVRVTDDCLGERYI